jgi:hypothetical protein
MVALWQKMKCFFDVHAWQKTDMLVFGYCQYAEVCKCLYCGVERCCEGIKKELLTIS